MTWNPDAPLDLLNRASLVYVELMGHAAYCNWLEQELPRVKIYLHYKTSVVFSASTERGGVREPQLTISAGAASIDPHLVDELVDTLRWYAAPLNYVKEAGKAGKAPIDNDVGARAMNVLKKYDAGSPA